jgi:phage terminase large subunit-like protein
MQEAVAAPRVRKIRPQAGPQEQFSACTADICFYGGSAGGGKSWALCYEAARYATVQSYAAVIFRRTSPELTGGGSIWEETKKLYPHLGGEPREHPALDWRFPASSLIEFRHLQYEGTVHDHQGKQYDFIGFDEITHFTAGQFWYMLSRLRSSGSSVPKRVRGTCNPDPDSFVRELIDWWIDADGKAIPDRSGVIRWLVRLDDALIWGDSADEVWSKDPERILRRGEQRRNEEDIRPEPMSFTFIRARAQDNKILLQNDPGYLSRLAMIPGAEGRRLLEGDWNTRDSAGDYFQRITFPVVELHTRPTEKNIRRRVRFWDKAATKPSAANPDPDWTEGMLVAELDDDSWIIEDLDSFREGPADVDARMKKCAEMDGRAVLVGIWQDPGQAGKVDVLHTQQQLSGWAVQEIVAHKNLLVYAKIPSQLAKQGKIKVLRREYLPRMFAQLEGFPRAGHDDIVSALCGVAQVLTGGGFQVGYDATPDTRHPLDSVNRDDGDDDNRSSRGEMFI